MVPILKSNSLPSDPTESNSASTTSQLDSLITEEESPVVFNSGPLSRPFHLPPRRRRGIHSTNPRRQRTTRRESEDQSVSTIPEAATAPAESQSILPAKDELDTQPSPSTQPILPEQPEECMAIPSESSPKDTSEEEPIATDEKAEALLRECLLHRSGAHEGRDPYGLASLPYLHSRTPLPWPRCTLCEEKMPWLVNAVYKETIRDDDIGHGAP